MRGEPKSRPSPVVSSRTDDVIKFGPFCLFVRERRFERDGRAVKVGSRALDTLMVLADRAGEVVSNEELTARVWPDTSVEESSLRVHIAGLRKALGDGKDGARYVTNVPGRGYCLVAQVSRSSSSTPPSPHRSAPRSHNLPSRLARIVGREDAIREISEQLSTTRFVSVVGPGGMGKTTVAVAVAHALAHDFGGDVQFVDLGSTTEARQVATSIASALGLVLQTGDATSSLVAFLQDRRTLLVLDSCEHVVDAVAPLAERIFQDAPTISLLTTSRESLRVEGEHVHRMMPLDVPPASERLGAAEAMTFAAVQLFVERATAAGARLALTDVDAPVVADICRKLDGIALAIELAATRVDAYGIRGTAALLENRFKFLWQGRRTALPRHQTLSAMLDWSYDLLSDREKAVLRRVSIFVGPFALDGVAAVASDVDVNAERAVDSLGSLVDKSLVSVDAACAEARYRLLDTTRAYAQSKLDEANEIAAAIKLQPSHAHLRIAFIRRPPKIGATV